MAVSGLDGAYNSSFSCGIKASSRSVCWTDIDRMTAPEVLKFPRDFGKVKSIAVGLSGVCAIRLNNTPVCWSVASDLLFGIRELRVPAGIGKVNRISVGGYDDTYPVGGESTCAIRTDNTPVCWGDNRYGQITLP